MCVRVLNVTVVCKGDRVAVDPTRSDEYQPEKCSAQVSNLLQFRR